MPENFQKTELMQDSWLDGLKVLKDLPLADHALNRIKSP